LAFVVPALAGSIDLGDCRQFVTTLQCINGVGFQQSTAPNCLIPGGVTNFRGTLHHVGVAMADGFISPQRVTSMRRLLGEHCYAWETSRINLLRHS
jgi:hypothetical protein